MSQFRWYLDPGRLSLNSPALTLSISLALLAIGLPSRAAEQCPAPEGYGNMRLTFNSDFRNAKALDQNLWRPVIGQHGGLDGELQVFTPDEIKLGAPHNLRIQTEQKLMWGHPFRSGELTTQGLFSQTYGHFEMMAKMPEANGLWPAFWMMAENGHWPPEIDIVEYIHPQTRAKGEIKQEASGVAVTTVHWADAQGQQHSLGQSNQQFYADLMRHPRASDDLGPSFHLYAVDWRPHQIGFSIDGNPTFCLRDSGNDDLSVPASPMFMILDDAVAAGTPTKPGWAGFLEPNVPFPVDFEIAYVRAFQFKDIVSAPRLDFDLHNVRLVEQTPTAGRTLTIEADANAGAHDLSPGNVTFELKRLYNPKYPDGLESVGSTASAHLPSLRANQTYHVHTSLIIPPNSPSGYYVLSASSSYQISFEKENDNNSQYQWRSGQAVSFFVNHTPN